MALRGARNARNQPQLYQKAIRSAVPLDFRSWDVLRNQDLPPSRAIFRDLLDNTTLPQFAR